MTMNNDTARVLVANLLERLAPADSGRTFRIEGHITAKEKEALEILAGVEPTIEPPMEKATEVAHDRKPVSVELTAVPTIGRAQLDLTAFGAQGEPGTYACIDFGTAFSKASVWRQGDDSPIPLDLEASNEGQHGLTVPSSIYISGGTLHFGASALEESRRENDPTRERFDSPKQSLSIDDPEDIDRGRLDAAVDPTGLFNRGDLLRLYLAYLTSCAVEQLEQNNFSRYTSRRFAIPVWKGQQLASASALLKKSLVQAQIIADSVDPDVWSKGMTVPFARSMLDALRDVDQSLIAGCNIVSDYVLEPMAAASGITDHLRNKHARVVVADIGAGTTDFGAYQFVLPNEGRARAHPFVDSESALKQAGNRLDEFLLRMVLEKSGTPSGTDDAARITKILKREIRQRKVEMLANGSTFISVPDLFDITVSQREFESDPHVKQFTKTFYDQIVKTMERAGATNFVERDVKKYAIVTGGGARIPMIRNLFDSPFETSLGPVKLELVDPTPDWAADFPEVIELFPQLAVSTGGASPDLIEVRSSVRDVTKAPEMRWSPRWT